MSNTAQCGLFDGRKQYYLYQKLQLIVLSKRDYPGVVNVEHQ